MEDFSRFSTIIFMYRDFIAITNAKLYGDNYMDVVKNIISLHPYALILREKELDDNEYCSLAKIVKKMCEEEGVLFFIHQRIKIARELDCLNIHLSFENFIRGVGIINGFDNVSVACHSVEEAVECQQKGATQIVLGTIFETECKKGVKGKGVSFVKEVTACCSIPVYAIGGLKESNMELIKAAGAAGGCMMSGFIKNDII